MLITPTCTCVVDELLALMACCMERYTRATIRLALKLRMVITTLPHATEVHMEREISEGTFGLDFKGTFCGNVSVVEFAEEVWMLDKFRRDQILHFYGTCVIPNHTS